MWEVAGSLQKKNVVPVTGRYLLTSSWYGGGVDVIDFPDPAHAFFIASCRRHTRWPRDWSSDVCSSDLRLGGDNAWDPEGPRKRLMDAPEVWALAQAGI